jgi:NAD(P)-dependent dehydrogenase (short-subunit alcohol dehydrogenase family)
MSASMAGRVVVVTGANSGIGKETAIALGAMGAQAVLCARNRAKGEAALAEAHRRVPGGSFELVDLDLASFSSIDACAEHLLASHDRIHVLVNNAGLIQKHRTTTAQGFETTFGVNHLGHFLLTGRLADRLRASAPARVVTVASDAHRFPRRGLDFDDLQTEHRYRAFKAYGRSKLANLLFTLELSRRLAGSGVTANAVHPGFVASNFSREGDTGFMGNVGMVLGRPFARSPAEGARTSVHVASAPELAAVTGKYFASSRITTPSSHARDDAAARRLWEISEQLVEAAR